jgi:hypothetical protein
MSEWNALLDQVENTKRSPLRPQMVIRAVSDLLPDDAVQNPVPLKNNAIAENRFYSMRYGQKLNEPPIPPLRSTKSLGRNGRSKGTRSERVEKCSPSARTEETGRCDRRSRAHFGSKTAVPIRCNRWFVSLEHPRTRSVTLLPRNKDRHVRWSDRQRHQSLRS